MLLEIGVYVYKALSFTLLVGISNGVTRHLQHC